MKFEFNQEKAAEIAALYNLEKRVLRVWKTRNEIPKKYFDDKGNIKQDVDTSENISEADKYRLIQILESEHLNLSEFTSLSISKIADLKRGKASITKNEFKSIKIELVNLKNKFEPVTTAKTFSQKCKELKGLFQNPLIKPYSFAETKELKYTVEKLLDKTYDPELDLVEQLIVNLAIFKQSLIL